jgi:REP element-mobilizing transposase RayT
MKWGRFNVLNCSYHHIANRRYRNDLLESESLKKVLQLILRLKDGAEERGCGKV